MLQRPSLHGSPHNRRREDGRWHHGHDCVASRHVVGTTTCKNHRSDDREGCHRSRHKRTRPFTGRRAGREQDQCKQDEERRDDGAAQLAGKAESDHEILGDADDPLESARTAPRTRRSRAEPGATAVRRAARGQAGPLPPLPCVARARVRRARSPPARRRTPRSSASPAPGPKRRPARKRPRLACQSPTEQPETDRDEQGHSA